MRNTGNVYHFRGLGPVIFSRLQVRDSLREKQSRCQYIQYVFPRCTNKHSKLLIDITVFLIIWQMVRFIINHLRFLCLVRQIFFSLKAFHTHTHRALSQL
jgi:hypothetical protein